jgi:hypothetical protein
MTLAKLVEYIEGCTPSLKADIRKQTAESRQQVEGGKGKGGVFLTLTKPGAHMQQCSASSRAAGTSS